MLGMNRYKYNINQYLRLLKYRYPSNHRAIFNLLLESQYWSKEKIIKFQLSELNKLLQTSLASSNYYKKILKDLDLPLKNIDEFIFKIPFINKGIIQKQSDQLKTEHFCTDFKHTTSGSSGDPLTVYISGLAASYREAGFVRFLSWWNVNPYDKNILIWGKKATAKSGISPINIVKKGFKIRFDINVFELDDNSIFKYYSDLEKIKPAFIRGYKSAILQFAELLESKNLFFKNFNFKVAIVTGEILRNEERHYIEKNLNCRVANEYGAAEIGQIAYECPSGLMHVFEEAVYLNANKDSEAFVTEMHNDSMPLINYKNDDRIILSNEKCVCGRNSSVISRIEGRVDDYIIKPDGNKIGQYLFYYIIKELDDIGLDNCVLKYKLIQNKNKFHILIVPSQKYTEKVEEYIKTRMYEKIGKEIIIEFSLVDSIPRDKSGKLRFFLRIN
jgi:phenylacetate-coenzyme A ligase PaaK-like adenylate-forming protein